MEMNKSNNSIIACPECGHQITKISRLLAQADYHCNGCGKTRWSQFVKCEPPEFKKAEQLVQANLVIMQSEDGENWSPVQQADVPEWVRKPEVIAQLAEGNACQGPGESTWYGAIHADDSGVQH